MRGRSALPRPPAGRKPAFRGGGSLPATGGALMIGLGGTLALSDSKS